MDRHIVDLFLLYSFLAGWEEDNPRVVKDEKKKKVFKSWKGFRFEILNELQARGLVWQIPGAKSLILTDKGQQEAEKLIKRYPG